MSVDDIFSGTLKNLDNSGNPVRPPRGGSQRIGSDGGTGGFQGVYYEGSGQFVSSRAPYIAPARTRSGEDGYTLNLVDAPIDAAAKIVLGDTLGVNYTIDSRVTGTVNLQTSAPVDVGTLIEIFETALAVNGASIVKRGQVYQIVPSSEALSSTPAVSVPSVAPGGPGVGVQVVQLNNIGAEEMQTILQPISRAGSIVRVDAKRNYLVLAGTAQDLRSMREAISVFDVDWMRGQSVALHPLKTARPADLAQELETIFGVKEGSGIIRFVPNDRLNSILVITSRASYLERASQWIAKLDNLAGNSKEELFVYQIQNRPAKELAEVLQSVLSGRSSIGDAAGSSVAPDLTQVSVGDGDTSGPDPERFGPVSSSGGNQDKVPSIVADVENNALLISTTAREYERIERILQQLDVLPIQVMLEAVIAEVRLNDELKYGIRWAIQSGSVKFNFTGLEDGNVEALPGAGFSFQTPSVQATLNALSSITDVNIISSPNVLALNNQPAVLQVGDQVPIVTQQSTATGAPNAPVINSVTLKDTGIILSVLPRINKSGRVLLDIEQEVSNVVPTTTSGIDSPTIQQRKLQTKVLVNDGEAVALGGLIQEQNSVKRSQTPILGDIPVVGNLFKQKTDQIARTELIIFIRPRVIRDIHEARDVTAEFRKRLQLDSAISTRRGGASQLEQDIKRLKY